MRQLAQIGDSQLAEQFAQSLVREGISLELAVDVAGTVIWVVREEDVPRSRELLQAFQSNPAAYLTGNAASSTVRAAQTAAPVSHRGRVVRAEEVWRRSEVRWDNCPTSIGLIAVSVLVAIVTQCGMTRNDVLMQLLIAPNDASWPAIWRAEPWRLLTPVILHFGVLHLGFNCLMLRDLGPPIESRIGVGRFFVLIALVAAPANVWQLHVSGPAFGGLSGIVYGLFGYVWMRSKTDFDWPYAVSPSVVVSMMGWFALCWLPGMPVANYVHLGGLLAGGALGALAGWLHSGGA